MPNYRRFVGVLPDANARLGADVDRYSFIVMDLHHHKRCFGIASAFKRAQR
jgi:hypothetical protein